MAMMKRYNMVLKFFEVVNRPEKQKKAGDSRQGKHECQHILMFKYPVNNSRNDDHGIKPCH